MDLDFVGDIEDYLVGFRPEDWIELLEEEAGTNVISPPRVTNIPRPAGTLTVNVEEYEPNPLEATKLNRTIEA